MWPIQQTIFGERGNCQSACLASLLELPLEEVPHFNADRDLYYVDMLAWLKARGYGLVSLDITQEHLDVWPGYLLVGGQSPRGDFLHAVIYRNGRMVHDPHPDGRGVTSIVDVDLIYPLDPARWSRIEEPC